MANLEYLFNDGSGTTVLETNGGPSLTVLGTPVWGSDYLSLAGLGNYWESPNGTNHNLNSFSVAVWISFNDISNVQDEIFFNIGNGDLGRSFYLALNPTPPQAGNANSPYVLVADGVTYTLIATSGGPAVTTGVKYLMCATYTRVGGAADNILTLRYTSDGTTWYSGSTSSARLFEQNSTYEVRSNFYQSFGNVNANARWYRTNVFDGLVLNNDQMQLIWDAGSEGSIEGLSFIQSMKTLGNLKILNVSGRPNLGAGISAPVASVALVNNENAGETWLKTGAGNTAWSRVSTI